MIDPSSVRAVISDLDGTLLRSDGSLGIATVAAVERLDDLGIPFVIATARTPAGLSVLDPIRSRVSAATCCNGAIGYDLATAELQWRSTFDSATVRAVAATAEKHVPGVGIAAYDGRRWVLDNAYLRARGRLPRGAAAESDRADVTSRPACMICLRHPALTSDEIARILNDGGVSAEMATLSIASSDALDITPPGTDKASGVVRSLNMLGVEPGAAIAFGDAPNDLPVFRLVGRGIAMADADAEVRSAALQTAESNDMDGVATAISKMWPVDEKTPIV